MPGPICVEIEDIGSRCDGEKERTARHEKKCYVGRTGWSAQYPMLDEEQERKERMVWSGYLCMYRPVHPWRCYTCTKLLNPTTAPSPAQPFPPSLPVQQQHAGAEWQDSEGSRSRLSERYLPLSSVLLPSPLLASPRRIKDVTCLECLALGRKPSIVALAHTPSRLKECFELEAPQRAPAPVAPQPDSPTDILHPLLGYAPVIHSSDGVLRKASHRHGSTSVSHAHHLTPQTQQLTPRGPREARQRGLFGDPLSPRGQNFNPCCVCLATVQRGRLNSRNDKSTSNCPDNTKPCPAW